LTENWYTVYTVARLLHVRECVHKKGHCLFRKTYRAPITMRESDVNNFLFVFNPTSIRCWKIIPCSVWYLLSFCLEKLCIAAYDSPCHFVWKNYTLQRMISLVILSGKIIHCSGWYPLSFCLEKLYIAADDIPCHFVWKNYTM